MKPYTILFAFIASVCLLASCQQDTAALRERIASLENKLADAYKPGWGEIMRGSTQVHHSNLWFAGVSGNWELAEHMIEELEEGFEKLETLHPEDEETTALPMIYPSLKALAETVENQDQEKFKNGYLALTNSCNACHAATGNEIYVIQVPDKPGFTNQRF